MKLSRKTLLAKRPLPVIVGARAGATSFDGREVASYRDLRTSMIDTGGHAARLSGAAVLCVAKRPRCLEEELRRAVKKKELTLFYQPQFQVADGRACGVEVLARWIHRRDGMIEPGIFIPLAERSRVIGALGAWVLQEACQSVSAWRSKGADSITLAVNVSPDQINASFADVVERALYGTGFPAYRLELEFTEGVLIGDGNMALECFRRLKALGVRIAIDDFGIGYSGLSYLSRLPVDRLKLDKSLVQNLNTRWRDVAILRSIIRLGKDLGIDVLAEGVETEQQFQVLRQLGCRQVQGYLLARPTPQSEAQAALARRWGIRYVPPPRVAIRASPGVPHAG